MKKLSKKLSLSRVTTTQLARTGGGDGTQVGCTSNYGPSCNEGSCYDSCHCVGGGGGGTDDPYYTFPCFL
ncbi:MAG: hypothetical protein KBG28_29035 [Kofleriaceae bacterium]|nr:hypothetical protein [Kofleriaceae bacterium]MBP9208047.1 hypothetical protein [Kofleriaceae bacterium]